MTHLSAAITYTKKADAVNQVSSANCIGALRVSLIRGAFRDGEVAAYVTRKFDIIRIEHLHRRAFF